MSLSSLKLLSLSLLLLFSSILFFFDNNNNNSVLFVNANIISVDSVLSCSKTKNSCYNLAYSCVAGSGCGTASSTKPQIYSCDYNTNVNNNNGEPTKVPNYFSTVTPCTRNFLECLSRVKNEILTSLITSSSESWEPECISFALESRSSLDARFPYQTVPLVCPFLSALSENIPLSSSSSSALNVGFNSSQTSFQRLLEVSPSCANPILNATLYSPTVSQYDCQCPMLSAVVQREKISSSSSRASNSATSSSSKTNTFEMSTSIVGGIGMFRQVFLTETVFQQEYPNFNAIRSSATTLASSQNFNCSLINSKQEEVLSALDSVSVALGSSNTQVQPATRYPIPISCTDQCEFTSYSTFPSIAVHPWLNFISGSWAHPSWTISISSSSTTTTTTTTKLSSPQLPFLQNTKNYTQVVKDFSSISPDLEISISSSNNFTFLNIPSSVLPLEFIGRLKWCDVNTFAVQKNNQVVFSSSTNRNTHDFSKQELTTRKMTFYEESGNVVDGSSSSSASSSCLVTESTTNECRCPQTFGDDSDGFPVEVSSFKIQIVQAIPTIGQQDDNRTLSMRSITFCHPPTIKIVTKIASSIVAKSTISQQQFLAENSMPVGSAVMTNMTITTWTRKIVNSTFVSFDLSQTELVFVSVPSQLPVLHRGESGIALTVLLVAPMVSYPVFPLVLGALSLASECNTVYQETFLMGLQSFAPTSVRAMFQTKLDTIRDFGGQLGFVAIVLVIAIMAIHFVSVFVWAISVGPIDENSSSSSSTAVNSNIIASLSQSQNLSQQQQQQLPNNNNNTQQNENHHSKAQSYSNNNNSDGIITPAITRNVVAFVEPQHERVEVSNYPTSSKKRNQDAGNLVNHHHSSTSLPSSSASVSPNNNNQQQQDISGDGNSNFIIRSIKRCLHPINSYFSQLPWASTFRNTLFPHLSGSLLFGMLPFLTFLSIKAAVTIPGKSEQEKKKDEKVDPGVILCIVVCFFLWMLLFRVVYKCARDNSYFYTSIKGMRASATSEWRVEDCPDMLYIYYDDETLEFFDKKLSFLAGTPFFVPEGGWLSENEVIRAVAQMPEVTHYQHEPLNNNNNNKNTTNNDDDAGLDDVVIMTNPVLHPLAQSPEKENTERGENNQQQQQQEQQQEENGGTTTTTTTKSQKVLLTQQPSQQFLPMQTKVKKRMESNNAHLASMNPFVKVNYYSKKKSSTSAILKNQLFGGRDSSINLHQLAAGVGGHSVAAMAAGILNNNNNNSTTPGATSISDTQSNVSNKSHHHNISSSRRRSSRHQFFNHHLHHHNLVFANAENIIHYKHYPGFLKTFAAMVTSTRLFRCVVKPFKLKYSLLGPLIMIFLMFLMSILTAIPASMIDCSAIYLVEIVLLIIVGALTVAFRPFRSAQENVFVAVCCLLTIFLARSCLSGVGAESMDGIFIAVVVLSFFGCFVTFVCSLTENFIWEATLIERHLMGIASAAAAAAAKENNNDNESSTNNRMMMMNNFTYPNRIRNDPEDIQRQQEEGLFFFSSSKKGDDDNHNGGGAITRRKKPPPVSQPLTPAHQGRTHINDPTGIVWIDDDDDDEIYEVIDRKQQQRNNNNNSSSFNNSILNNNNNNNVPSAAAVSSSSAGFVPESHNLHQQQEEEMKKFQQQTKFKSGRGVGGGSGDFSSDEENVVVIGGDDHQKQKRKIQNNNDDDEDEVTEMDQRQETTTKNIVASASAAAINQQQQNEIDNNQDNTNNNSKKLKSRKVVKQQRKRRNSEKSDGNATNKQVVTSVITNSHQNDDLVFTDDDLHQTASNIHSVSNNGDLSSNNNDNTTTTTNTMNETAEVMLMSKDQNNRSQSNFEKQQQQPVTIATTAATSSINDYNNTNNILPRLIVPAMSSNNFNNNNNSRGPTPTIIQVKTPTAHGGASAGDNNNNNNLNVNVGVAVAGGLTHSRSTDGSSFRSGPSSSNQQLQQNQNNNNNLQQSMSRRPSSVGLGLNDDNVSNHQS